MPEFHFLQKTPATAYLFPGQGSQQVGMAQELANLYPAAKRTFAEADDLLGFGLSQLCFHGPEDELTDTLNVQPALLTVCVAILRAIKEELGQAAFTPESAHSSCFVAGHSLGEYTALVAAGSLSFADGLRLVRERGRLMKAAGEQQPGMMAAILGLDEDKVAAICAEATTHSGIAQVANDNCPGQVVISGDRPGMEAAMAALSAAGARRVMPLAVSIASHCPLMQPAADALRGVIEATPLAPPAMPLIANTSGQPLTDMAAIRAELAAQLTGSVRWAASMHYLLHAGVTQFIEIGPGDVLAGLLKRIDRSAQRQTVNTPETVQALVKTFGANLVRLPSSGKVGTDNPVDQADLPGRLVIPDEPK
jgi:[acyl-carrier-protein] S-malonyltransferase